MSTQLQQVRAAIRGKTATGPDASWWSRVGFWAGVSVIQLVVLEFVVSATWRGLYSYRTNFVSELGVAFCGPAGNWPCSKLYVLMNFSIALFNAALVVAALAWMITGVLDVRGGVLLSVAGLGGIVAGTVNQGLNYQIHSFGAMVVLIVGSLGIIVAGGHRTLDRASKITVTALGGIALAAALFFISGHHFGIGIGAVERIAVYSILVATVVLAFAHRNTARRVAARAGATNDDRRR